MTLGYTSPATTTAALIGFFLALSPSAHAEPAQSTVWDVRFGPALLLKSQSKVPRHLLKPDLRLGGRASLGDRWEVGAALQGILDGSEHYRVLGLMGHGRYAPLMADAFSLGVSAGLGAGYDADILHADLEADGRVAPYYVLALDARWELGRLLLGAEGAFQNLAMVQLGALVGTRW